ncbi:DUF4139 domain-containing protein [Allocoleopsis sp.]|uniref:DUF4139 domain-containing protein n=1 Tax=Allocoleopsis sp. TaxID=3088169 RepID=UPI002FD036DA
MVMSDDKTPSVYTQLTSRIDKVKIYAAGATVTRVADLQLGAGEIPEHVEMAGLPLALDDSSVRVRVEAELGGSTAIATDVRIGLAVPSRHAVQNSPSDEEVREAKAEVRRISDAIALIDNEIAILYQLEVPERPDGEEGKAPPPSPLSARLALTNFKDEQVRARITEKRETKEKLRQAQDNLNDLLQKQARASSAREVRPNELRKTVIVRLSYEGEPSTVEGQRLVVEYFVPGARWTPTYICRLDSVANQATIAVRALICQRTGEDWSGVRLELSTAEPLAWCELPQLPSLRLGRAQPVLRKSGWRLPPSGAEILFENFDRQKQAVLSAVHQPSIISDIFSPKVPPLDNLAVSTPMYRAGRFELHKEEIELRKQSLNDELGTPISERFTEKAIKAIALAQEESRRLGHNFIGTEQILLGLIAEDTGLAAEVLKSMGIKLKDARIEVEKIIGRGSGLVPVENPSLTPRAQRLLEQSLEEARKLGHNYIGTEHLLLSLSQVEEGNSPRILENLGVDLTQVRTQQIRRIGETAGVTADRSQERTKAFSRNKSEMRREKPMAKASAPLDAFDITLISPGMIDELDDEIGGLMEQMPPSAPPAPRRRMEEDFISDRLAYSLMRMGAADDLTKRGKLSIEQRQEVYLEILQRRNVVVGFDVIEVVQQATSDSQNCVYVNLPAGGIQVRTVAGSFDYAYNADGRVDVPSDGEFHSVALTSNSTDVDLRYVVVPREDINVFRIAQLKNPLQAPLLAGPADVYVDGEYILSTNITTVPPKGQMELGLGVEQAIKVARNTSYQEVRSGETLVAFNELRHNIQIDIANRLPREARIEVRERIPIPDADAKVDVQMDRVSPEWEKYEQKERGAPIRGGYRWQVQVPGGEQTMLSVQYTVKTFVDSELIGGNRRE